jgi:hypothetical protein
LNEVKKGAIAFFMVWSMGISGCVYVAIEKDHENTTANEIIETDLETINTETANTTIKKGDENGED